MRDVDWILCFFAEVGTAGILKVSVVLILSDTLVRLTSLFLFRTNDPCLSFSDFTKNIENQISENSNF